eukprot:TRINITY_DN44453_c0_g1_i1.p1 TRINITY_DN44453_c0_g1~~TRINITY_DN44453_c0_g1_i1.p1  ORF type:complete len:656 (+),score=117.26 TRINITY_DN44453_c0_g1_i1:2-1969(+)
MFVFLARAMALPFLRGILKPILAVLVASNAVGVTAEPTDFATDGRSDGHVAVASTPSDVEEASCSFDCNVFTAIVDDNKFTASSAGGNEVFPDVGSGSGQSCRHGHTGSEACLHDFSAASLSGGAASTNATQAKHKQPVSVFAPVMFFLLCLVCPIAGSIVYHCWKNRREERSKWRTAEFDMKVKLLWEARRSLAKKGDCRHAPCPVCLEPLPEMPHLSFTDGPLERGGELLRCGHVFHEACIARILSNRNSCPVCRKKRPRLPKNICSDDGQRRLIVSPYHVGRGASASRSSRPGSRSRSGKSGKSGDSSRCPRRGAAFASAARAAATASPERALVGSGPSATQRRRKLGRDGSRTRPRQAGARTCRKDGIFGEDSDEDDGNDDEPTPTTDKMAASTEMLEAADAESDTEASVVEELPVKALASAVDVAEVDAGTMAPETEKAVASDAVAAVAPPVTTASVVAPATALPSQKPAKRMPLSRSTCQTQASMTEAPSWLCERIQAAKGGLLSDRSGSSSSPRDRSDETPPSVLHDTFKAPRWRHQVAALDDDFWFFTFDRLTEEYRDLPKVSLARNRMSSAASSVAQMKKKAKVTACNSADRRKDLLAGKTFEGLSGSGKDVAAACQKPSRPRPPARSAFDHFVSKLKLSGGNDGG